MKNTPKIYINWLLIIEYIVLLLTIKDRKSNSCEIFRLLCTLNGQCFQMDICAVCWHLLHRKLWQKGDQTPQESLQLLLFSCRWPVLGCQWLPHRGRVPQAHSEPGLPHQCQENRCSRSWPLYQENLFLCRRQVLEVRFFSLLYKR